MPYHAWKVDATAFGCRRVPGISFPVSDVKDISDDDDDYGVWEVAARLEECGARMSGGQPDLANGEAHVDERDNQPDDDDWIGSWITPSLTVSMHGMKSRDH